MSANLTTPDSGVTPHRVFPATPPQSAVGYHTCANDRTPTTGTQDPNRWQQPRFVWKPGYEPSPESVRAVHRLNDLDRDTDRALTRSFGGWAVLGLLMCSLIGGMVATGHWSLDHLSTVGEHVAVTSAGVLALTGLGALVCIDPIASLLAHRLGGPALRQVADELADGLLAVYLPEDPLQVRISAVETAAAGLGATMRADVLTLLRQYRWLAAVLGPDVSAVTVLAHHDARVGGTGSTQVEKDRQQDTARLEEAVASIEVTVREALTAERAVATSIVAETTDPTARVDRRIRAAEATMASVDRETLQVQTLLGTYRDSLRSSH